MKRNAITIFDVDDTLVVTKSKIKVHNPKTGFSAELTPQEFNTFFLRGTTIVLQIIFCKNKRKKFKVYY